MEAFLGYLLKNIKKYSGTLLEIILVFIILLLVTTSSIEINNSLRNGLIISCIFTLFIIYIIQTLISKKIPHSNKKTDILVRILANTENEYQDFHNTFIDELISYTKNQTSDFNFLIIPYKAINRSLKLSDNKLFKKSKCSLLLNIKIISNKVDNDTNYIADFHFSYDDSQYNSKIKKRLRYELKYLTQNLTDLKYTNHNKLETYTIISHKIYDISFYLYTKIHLYLKNKYTETIKNR